MSNSRSSSATLPPPGLQDLGGGFVLALARRRPELFGIRVVGVFPLSPPPPTGWFRTAWSAGCSGWRVGSACWPSTCGGCS
jgi:pimeloyl-ACP methyl ester carboxylesterase